LKGSKTRDNFIETAENAIQVNTFFSLVFCKLINASLLLLSPMDGHDARDVASGYTQEMGYCVTERSS